MINDDFTCMISETLNELWTHPKIKTLLASVTLSLASLEIVQKNLLGSSIRVNPRTSEQNQNPKILASLENCTKESARII